MLLYKSAQKIVVHDIPPHFYTCSILVNAFIYIFASLCIRNYAKFKLIFFPPSSERIHDETNERESVDK